MRRFSSKVDDWVSAGVISQHQADEILSMEARARGREVPVVFEILGYLGGALTLAAAPALTSELWEHLATAVKLAMLGALAIVLWWGGRALEDRTSAAAGRLGSFLWAAAVTIAAYFFGYLVAELWSGLDASEVVLAGSLGAAPFAVALWQRRPKMLQQLVMFAATVTALVAGVDVLGGELEAWGSSLFVLGVIWLALGWRNLAKPEQTAYSLASIGILSGAQLLAEAHAAGYGLGLVAAGALLALGSRYKHLVLMGFGTAGVFLFSTQLVFEYLGDTPFASLVLFVAGVGLVAAVTTARRRMARRPSS